jgi:hypothetical protein
MRNLIIVIFLICIYKSNSQVFDFIAHFEGTCQSAEIKGNYAYFNSGQNINIIEISDPDNIILINTFHTGYFFPVDIKYYNGYLFICSGVKGFLIYDVSNPMIPQFVSWVNWPECKYGFESIIQDSIILIDEWHEESVSIFDITDLYNPTFLSRIEFPINQNNAYALNKNILYGFEVDINSTYDHYIRAYNISNTTLPELKTELRLCGESEEPYPDDMLIYDESLLVAFDDTIKIYDISFSDTIIYSGKFFIPYEVSKMHLQGDTLFLLCSTYGIVLYNVSDILNPDFLGIFEQINAIDKISTKNDILTTSLGYKGFELFKISELTNPLKKYEFKHTDEVQAIEIQNNLAYIGMYENGVQIVDITNPFEPVHLGNIGLVKRIERFEYYQGFLFCREDSEYHTIHIIDVNDPGNPIKVNEIYTSGFISDFKINNNVLYLMVDTKWLKFFDITNPALPVEEASYQQDGSRIDVYGNLLVMIYKAETKFYYRIKTFKLGPNYSIIACDNKVFGNPPNYNPREIIINYPYIHIGVSNGVVVAKVNELFNVSFCDEIIYTGWSQFTQTINSDNDYIYLSGHFNGIDQLLIIDIQNPFNLNIIKSINRYVLNIALKPNLIFTSESQNGYSIFGDNSVGFSEQIMKSFNSQSNIYPNPTRDRITINNNSDFHQTNTISIFKINGQKVMEQNFQNQKQVEIDTSTLPKGIYLVKIQAKEGTEFKKLVKQ